MHLLSQDSNVISNCLKRDSNKYLSPAIQNKIWTLMSDEILRNIAKKIKNENASGVFAILLDETTYASRKERVSICLRHVNNKLDIFEHFIDVASVRSVLSN